MDLELESPAPDFTLQNHHGQPVTLSQFAGVKEVVLVFYPYAFSRVCTGELCELRDRFGELADDQTEVLAISCDHFFSLRAYAEADGYPFSLLSDFWPHGAVARAYGVFDEELGCARRSTFIIDRAGVLRWSVHNAMGEARSPDEYRDRLAQIRVLSR